MGALEMNKSYKSFLDSYFPSAILFLLISL